MADQPDVYQSRPANEFHLCVCAHLTISLPFIFKHHPLLPPVPSVHYCFCCIKQMAVDLPQGDADESIPG